MTLLRVCLAITDLSPKISEVPADYEFDIDHRLIDMAAWDHVSIDDFLACFKKLTTLPGDMSGCVEYLDLSEASAIAISRTGALQLGTVYEELIDRGLRGMVIYAPSQTATQTARMIMSTLTALVGAMPEGFRIVRDPLPASEIRNYISNTPQEGVALIA